MRWLATRDGVRIARLEPSPQAEAAAVLERFPLEQVGLFYVLRAAARLRDRQGVAGAALTEAVETLIARMAAMEGLPVAFRTRTEFEEAYRRAFEAPADWREVPTEWFAPTPGPRFTQAINRASSGFRNLHMVEVLSTDVLRGERVFAVVGRDHLPRQEPALRCAIEGAGSGER